MKNALIVILVLTTLSGGYYVATSELRLNAFDRQGKTERIARGDLTLPINATGEIRPARRVEIKAEASGQVLEILKQPGDRVRTGDLMIRLEPSDEQRSVDRAELEMQRTEARLEIARIALEQTRHADLDSARAQVDQLQAQLTLYEFRLRKINSLEEHQRNEEELIQRQTTVAGQKAQLVQARASVEKIKLAIRRAEQEVKQADASHKSAQTTMADASKRLAKTDIIAPIDGIVGDLRAQIGEVIQGGKTTLTGGTVLATVLEVNKLMVRAEVDEADIGRVLAIAPPWAKPGNEGLIPMPADPRQAQRSEKTQPKITVESFRDREFNGVIERIFPEPKSFNNVVTYMVDVVIISENRDMLLPGMRADVRFTSEHVADALLCPNEAIRRGPRDRLGVYVPKAGEMVQEGETEFLECTFGLDNGNYSQVLCEELKEGMSVYTKLPIKDPDEKNSRK